MTPIDIGTSAVSAVQAGMVTTYGSYLPIAIAFLVALYPLSLLVGFIKGKLGRGKVGRL